MLARSVEAQVLLRDAAHTELLVSEENPCCMIVQMSSAKRHDRATENSSDSVRPESSTGATRTAVQGKSKELLVLCSSSDEELSQRTTWQNGALEVRSHATWTTWSACACDGDACHDCAVEPQRRQGGPDKPAG